MGVGRGTHIGARAPSCFGLFTAGTSKQREVWLPAMLSGEQLGAHCLSESHAGSGPAAMRTRANLEGDECVINGTKAWTTHAGQADFYKVMARTSDNGGRVPMVSSSGSTLAMGFLASLRAGADQEDEAVYSCA